MPQIPEFDAGNLALRPTETGVEARARTASRVGGFFNQQAGAIQMLAQETNRLGGETSRLGSETATLGERKGAALSDTGRRIGSSISDAGDAAVKFLDHQQISQGAATWATVLQQATQDWNDRVKNANPNDPTVAAKFLDSLNDRLAKFQNDGSFYTENGQKWAEAHVEALRQHMAETTMSDMSRLAGEAVKVNQRQVINSLSSTVHSDPSSLDFSLAALKSSTEGLISTSPNLTGTQAAAIRSELYQSGAESIVKAAAIGYITKTATVPPWASDPKYAPYINGTELKQFENAAKVQAKTNALTDKQAAVAERQLADQNVHATANDIMTKNIKIDPVTHRPIIAPQFFQQALDLARNNPNAPSASTTARTLIDWAEGQQNPRDVVSDPTIKADLATRLFDPSKPTTTIDIMRAETQGKLSHTDASILRGNVKELEETPLKGPVYADTMKAVHDALVVNVPGIPGKDEKGTAAYASFVQNFVPQYVSKFKAGTLEPNALDVNDPNSMISKAMAPFKRTPAQRMSDYVAGAGGLSPAAPAADTIPTVTTKEAYEKLPVGKIYIGKDGQKYEKR